MTQSPAPGAKPSQISEARNPVRAAIMLLVDEAAASGKTVIAEDVARAVSADNWRKLLKEVRSEAVRLARDGRIGIYRKGKLADPDDFKGVYRLGPAGE